MAEGTQRHVVPLNQGVYSVSRVCRILGTTMTPRKVHYWLDTGLLSEPIRHGSIGRPTLLSFRQLLEIRTVQRLRDDLGVSLPKVRDSFAWIIHHQFGDDPTRVHFALEGRDLVAEADNERVSVPRGQGVLALTDMNTVMTVNFDAWVERRLGISKYIEANARVQGGAPTIKGTRIETTFVASFSENGVYEADDLTALREMHAQIPAQAFREAYSFEGVRAA